VRAEIRSSGKQEELSRACGSLRINVRQAALCVALTVSLAAGAGPSGRPGQKPTLPDLPHVALGNALPAARADIQKAYEAVMTHPQDASANGKLGMLLHAYNFLAEAEVCYRRALLLDASSSRWAYYLGVIKVDQRNCNEAVTMFRESLRLDPNYLPAQLRMAECLLVSNEWKEAGDLYEAIVQRHPDCAEAYYGLGRVRAAHKDFDGAVESFRKACQLFPQFAAAHFATARAYQRLGRTDQAKEELALSKNSGGGPPEIEDPLLAEVEELYRDYNAYLKMGEALGGAGKLKDAADAYEEALGINPQIPEAHIRLIYIYGQLSQVTKAEEHYRAAVRLDPNRAEAYFNYGVVGLNQGRSQEAEEAFRQALRIDPRYAQAHNNLGYILEGEGKVADAVAEFRKALESRPDFPQAHFSLGRILVKQEDHEQGIPHLHQALTIDDEEAKASYLDAFAIAYADLGDLSNGLRYLHLARDKAAVRHQTALLKSIDDDLQLLEGAPAHTDPVKQ